MEKIEIIIPKDPIPRMRARIGKWGGYDPQAKEIAYVKAIIHAFMLENRLEWPLFDRESPISVQSVFHRPIPKKTSQKRIKQLNGTPCTKKPDIDNYEKLVLDALSGFIYVDDSQVVETYSLKIYSTLPKSIICVSLYTNRDTHMEIL